MENGLVLNLFDAFRGVEYTVIAVQTSEIPFYHLYWPLLKDAQDWLRDRSTSDLPWSNAAISTACRSLAKRLSQVGEKTLMQEFDAFRSAHLPKRASSEAAGGQGQFSKDAHLYHLFCENFLRGEYRVVLGRYPELLRLLVLAGQQWRQQLDLLINRLDADQGDVGELLELSPQALHIAEIEMNLSDPHEGGQSVCILSFVGGQRIVYKPKPLAPDWHLYEVYTFFYQRCRAASKLQLPRLIVKNGYGWAEYIDPNRAVLAPRTLFAACGILLFAYYLLRGTDLIADNIRVYGRTLVPIDCEILLQPQFCRSPEESQYEALLQSLIKLMEHSVIDTALLPRWLVQDNQIMDVSGLCGSVQHQLRRVWTVAYANTDFMFFQRTYRESKGDPCLQHMTPDAVNQACPALLEGFADAYRVLLANKEAVEQLIEERLGSLQLRITLRATFAYSEILSASLAPEWLTSSRRRWQYIRRCLAEPAFQSDKIKSFAHATHHTQVRILHAEAHQLFNLDIPKFQFYANGIDLLTAGDRRIVGCLRQSGIDYFRTVRLPSLCETDLQAQLRLIRDSFACFLRHYRVPQLAFAAPTVELLGSMPTAAASAAPAPVQLASDLLAQLWAAEFRVDAPPGPFSYWVEARDVQGYCQIIPLRFGLYDGFAGLLYLSAVLEGTNVLAASRARRLNDLTAPLQWLAAEPASLQQLASAMGKHPLTGFPSLVLGLLPCLGRSSDLWPYIDHFLHLFPAAAIACQERQQFDLYGGLAGLLLILARIVKAFPHLGYAETAAISGWQALGEQLALLTSSSAEAKPVRLGLAHGLIGMLYAFDQLAHSLSLENGRQRQQILAGLKAQIAAELGRIADWGRYCSVQASLQQNAWGYLSTCGGLSGILLAAIRTEGLTELLANHLDPILTTYEQVLCNAPALLLEPSLCCGLAGQSLCLRELARLTFLDRYRTATLERLTQRNLELLCEALRSQQQSNYSLILKPGLFQGLSGCIFALLESELSLPNPLLLETVREDV